jgi:predicted alpha/beta-hydrolase family hydrolase
MKDLEERQRVMRQRMTREAHRKDDDAPATALPHHGTAAETESTDLSQLKKRLAVLEAENAKLRSENESLRRQKTVYVERQKSPDEERREQQHNYFKYSNARRW